MPCHALAYWCQTTEVLNCCREPVGRLPSFPRQHARTAPFPDRCLPKTTWPSRAQHHVEDFGPASALALHKLLQLAIGDAVGRDAPAFLIAFKPDFPPRSIDQQ